MRNRRKRRNPFSLRLSDYSLNPIRCLRLRGDQATPEVIAAAQAASSLIADRGYDANHFRRELKAARTTPIIPGTRSRKRLTRHDERRYRDRWRIEAAI